MPRPLRFGVALRNAPDGDPAAQAQRAEALGFDVVVASDHLGPGLSPMLALAAAAQATALSGERHSDSFDRRLDLALVAVGALVGKCAP